MTIQKTRYEYQDASITVKFDAENHEDEWANNNDLSRAIQDVIRCAANWKTFNLAIKSNGYTDG